MLPLVLALAVASFAVSLPLTWALVRLGHRLGTFDSAGVPGQVKAPRRRVPNTGGVAIFWGIALPMLLGLAFVWAFVDNKMELPAALQPLREHFLGVRQQTPLALSL